MNEANYNIIYSDKCIYLAIKAADLDVENGDEIQLEVNSENLIFFRAPPYFLRIPAYKCIKPGEYFPDLSSTDKGIYKYKIPILEQTMDSINRKTGLNQNFYGFDSKYYGELTIQNNQDMKSLSNPEKYTHEERNRKKMEDEEKDFNPEHYGTDYVQYVIDGLSIDPYDFSYNQYPSEEQLKTIKAILKDGEKLNVPPIQNAKAVWLGLIDILLAVMYDKMTNANEINVAISHVNIHAISSTLSYFAEYDEMRDVVKSFYRRSIIYPFYRNKDITLKCLMALIQGFRSEKAKDWTLEKLIYAFNAFTENECIILNHFFIKDYIKYVSWTMADEIFMAAADQIESEHIKFRVIDTGFNLDEIEEKYVHDIIGKYNGHDVDSDDYCSDEENEEESDYSSSACNSDSDSSNEYVTAEKVDNDLSSIKEEDDEEDNEIAKKISNMRI